MASELTPEQIRGAHFRAVLRGLDRNEVETFLNDVATLVEALRAENGKLAAQLGDKTSPDLESELDRVGREVSGILQVAREAAESMRERASVDAARWRSEAMAETDEGRRDAAADAEAMRRDAWTTGSELLKQSQAEATRIREQAERDVLTVMGEAEREAHRLTSGARREAEDVLRSATMDAEKTTSEAAKRRDGIIEAANRAAAQAQERTRALEQRREELLEELENVRSTLTRLEGSLEERREAMDLSADRSTVRVVPSRPPVVEEDGEIRRWEPGETVRVVPPELPGHPEHPEPLAEEPEPEPAVEEPLSEEPEPEPALETEPTPVQPDVSPIPGSDDVSALFASLRGGGHVEPGESLSAPEPMQAPPPKPARTTELPTDWIEVRDTRLLPITNRALRGTKRALAELQNIALDSLRTDEAWRPEPSVIGENLQADLITAWAESFAAGHTAAEEMIGSKLKRPPTPPSDGTAEFARALSEAVANALDQAGEGQRERQSAASRVYRVWRTDEAERRIRELAIHAFERGVEESADVGEPVG